MEKKPYITIKNVGPIKDVTLPLNKVNVLIGPQSSGKSTIAKIISFCSWLEKEMTISQMTVDTDSDFIKKNLFDYHRVGSYFDENSEVVYEDDCMKFTFSNMRGKTFRGEHFLDSLSHKTAYIPAERIIASTPGVRSFSLFHSSLQTFLFDWWKMGAIYTKEHAVTIPDTGVNYFFDEKNNREIVQLASGKEINISEASSGLQSLIPMYVYLKYVTEWVFEHEDLQSFDRSKIYDKAVLRRIMLSDNDGTTEKDVERYIEEKKPDLSLNSLVTAIRNLRAHGAELDSHMLDIITFADNILHAHYANIIIEEPELNLFPTTQIEFLYSLLRMFKTDRDMMVITTHSPYMLYALNNCMIAYSVKEKLCDPALKEAIDFHGEPIDPSLVSVWELRDGKLVGLSNDNQTIQDERGYIRSNYFNRIMKNVMSDFSNLMSLQ